MQCSGSEHAQVACCFAHGTVPLSSIKDGKILDNLKDYYFEFHKSRDNSSPPEVLLSFSFIKDGYILGHLGDY
jgi:hypothetical protein